MSRPTTPSARSGRPHARIALAALLAASLAACSPSSDPAKVVADARAALERNDPREAEVRLKDLLQSGKDGAEPRELLGRAHLALGDLPSAEKELRRALDLGGDRDRIAPALIDALVRMGQFDKAVSDAETLKVDSPQARADVQSSLGRAQLARGRRAEAQRAFESALAAQPGFAPARAGLLRIRAATDPKGALEATLTELRAAPESPELAQLAGELQLYSGQPEAARDSFRQVTRLRPREPQPRAQLATVLIDLNDLDGAARELDELRKLAPDSIGTLHVAGLLAFRRNDLPAARDAVQQIQRVAPDHLPAAALGASVALATNAPALAERNARLLVDRAPESPQGPRLLAGAYLQLNAPDKALATLQPWLARGVQDPAMLTLAGEAALKTGDFASSAKWFQRAAELDPNDPRKRTGLALARLSGGDRERGFAELEAAAKLPTDSAQADFALVSARLRDRDYDRALAAADALVAKRPQDPAAHNARGTVLLAKKDLAGARAAFEQAAKVSPKDMAAAGNLATLDLHENRKADARKRYETVLAADPKSVPARLALARMAALDGDKDGARRELDAARAAEPEAIEPLSGLAGWHLDYGSPRDAVSLLQEGVAKNPDRVELVELLARAQARAGERAQALASLDRLAGLRPDSAPLQMRVGELKRSLKDEPGALAAFRRAAELAPKAVEPRVATASMLLATGRRPEARQVATGLQRDVPKSPVGSLLLGDVAAAEGNWGEAAEHYRKANAVARTPAGGIKLHQALARTGRESEADASLREHLGARPDDLGARLYLGEQLLGRKRLPEAAEQYRAVLSRDPRNALALNNLAWALHQQKDPKALDYAQQALAAAPQSAPVMDTAGVILAERGDSARAVELLRQAVQIAPREPQYRLHLAQALAKRGDKAGAEEQLSSLLKDTPNGPLADAARELQGRL